MKYEILTVNLDRPQALCDPLQHWKQKEHVEVIRMRRPQQIAQVHGNVSKHGCTKQVSMWQDQDTQAQNRC